MQSALAAAPGSLSARTRPYTPPCAPSTSGRPACAGTARGRGELLVARAGKDDHDEKIRREHKKADFSALWALRIRNFFSSRHNYLREAEGGGDEEGQKKSRQAKLAKQQAELERMREEIIRERVAELQAEEAAGQLRQPRAAADVARARLDLQDSFAVRVTLAVMRTQELLRAIILLPFSTAGAAMRAWQQLFSSQRYENFLMSEGERIWGWRNRTENERWFWEVFAWERLAFPLLCVVCYEYVVPNHLLWAVVVPLALLSWLAGRTMGPDCLEFWAVAYLGFYRKCWPDVSAWLAANVLMW